jgi:hypothetical protein
MYQAFGLSPVETHTPPPPLPTAFFFFSLHTSRRRIEAGNASIRVPLLPPAQGVTHPSLRAVFRTSRANGGLPHLRGEWQRVPASIRVQGTTGPRRHRGDSPYSARAWQRHRPPHLRGCLRHRPPHLRGCLKSLGITVSRDGRPPLWI